MLDALYIEKTLEWAVGRGRVCERKMHIYHRRRTQWKKCLC